MDRFVLPLLALAGLACSAPAQLSPEQLERAARRAIARDRAEQGEAAARLEDQLAELRSRPLSAAATATAWHELTRELWTAARQRGVRQVALEQELALTAPVVEREVALAGERCTALGGHGAAAHLELARARLQLDVGRRYQRAGQREQALDALRQALESCRAVEELWRGLFARFDRGDLMARWREDARFAIDSSRSGRTTLLVDKLRRRLEVFRDGRLQLELPAEIGGRGLARKLHEGDLATPEGRYRITSIKVHGQTSYYKAFLLDYPNEDDRRRYAAARASGKVPAGAGIGGLIEIHGDGGRGTDWTEGCVALSNDDMDRLHRMVRVGTQVVIVGTYDDV